jgi:hypothetical protein
MTFLDSALTGKLFKDCLHTFNNSSANTPSSFLGGEIYYLSDGGYSRIKWDQWKDKGVILLSESRYDEVKEALQRSKEMISDLNDFLAAY